MKIQHLTKGILGLSVVSLLHLFVSCKSSESASDSNATTTSSTTTTTTSASTSTAADDEDETTIEAAVNALSSSFPGSLALAIFSNETSSSSLAEDANYNPAAVTMETKVKEAEDIINGTADSCLPASLSKTFSKESDETCYEFDQDMIYGTGDSRTGTSTPKWLGTKDGKNADGEACLVAFTRNQVSQVIAMVDQTLGFGMSALCQAKKTDPNVMLPEVGETLDLKTPLKELFGTDATVTAGLLERLADYTDAESNVRKMYRISIEITKDDITRTIGIIHSPVDEENTEYSGTLYVEMDGELGEGGAAAGGAPAGGAPAGGAVVGGAPAGGAPVALALAQESKNRFMSIVYSRTAETGENPHLKAELRTAQIAESLADDAIGADGVLNYNVGAAFTATKGQATYGAYTGFSQANDAIAGISYISFDIDTVTSEGSLSYWKNPGGNYYENARGFNIMIERDADDNLGGCATSGAASVDFTNGTSIRRYLNSTEASASLTLQAKGFWHPFMNSSTSTGSDTDGAFRLRTQNSGQMTKWYTPLLENTALAGTFSTQSDGSLITRQCFKQNETTGLYEIDAEEIPDAAGYEVLDTGNVSNSAKFIAPPNVTDAKPFEGELKKEVLD